MTSLFLFTSYPLWSETFLRQDLMFLQKANVPLVPVSLFPGDCEPQEGWPKATVLMPNAQPAKPPAKRSLKSKLAAHLPVSIHTSLTRFKHRHLTAKLEQLVIDTNATHVHAEFADLAAVLAATVARKRNITYSLGIHAFDIHASKFDLNELFSQATFITVCNQSAYDACLDKIPCVKDKLHLIYHGVNLDFWNKQPLRQRNDNVLKLLFIGRLVPKKGIPILLDAMGILKQRQCETSLSVVGQGPMQQQLMEQAQANNIADNIQWLGVQTSAQIHDLMPTIDCLCAPSIVTPDGDRDGIPNVILEAMASGIPVVASQVGSISEVITPETGWPIQNLTPQTLADALQDVINTTTETLELKSANARQCVAQRFDAKLLAQQRATLFPKN